MPTTALADSYPAGATATATINVPDPRGPVRPAYLSVEKRGDNDWARVATDGDWATRIEWHYGDGAWTTTMTWHIPRDAVAGDYRMSYAEQVVGGFTVTSAT